MSADIDNPESAAGAVQPCPAPANPCQGQGMSSQAQIDSFAEGMEGLQKEWPKLKPDERLARMQALVNGQAAKNGFPPPEVVTGEGLGQCNGELRFAKWQVAINPSLVQSNSLGPEQSAQLGDTLYHETRHAEQWNLIARRQAAEGLSRDQIRNQMGVPRNVAKEASKHPLSTSDSRRACGDAMYKSIYGTDANARNTTVSNLDKQGKQVNDANEEYSKAKAEEDRLRAHLASEQKAYRDRKDGLPSPTTAELDGLAARCNETKTKLEGAQTATQERLETAQSAYSTYKKTYADYRALPEEADAWDSGGRASDAINLRLTTPKKVVP